MSLGLGLGLTGCSQEPAEAEIFPACIELSERDTTMTKLVWQEVFGEYDIEPPPVQLLTGNQLTCGDPTLPPDGFTANGSPQCLLGMFWPQLYKIQVAAPAGKRCSDTSYVHELTHAYFNLHDIPGNFDHTNEAFWQGGLITKTNNRLRTLGY